MQLTVNEEIVAAIWKEVLGLETVSTQDNFFDLGGNSLLMIKVYTRLCEAIHNNLLVVDLFRYSTIEKLAEAIGPLGPIQMPATPVGSSKALELARAQAQKQREAIERRRQIMQREGR
jgi:Phosphopantetheine attachment site